MEAKLCFIGHALMENRSGLIVDARLTRVSGHAERIAALDMIEPRADRPRAITLGADKGYDAEDFVEELRTLNVRPHVAQNTNGRRSAIDGRTTRHPGYAAASASASGSRSLRLDQDRGRPAQDQAPRPRQGRMGLHLRRRRLQPRPPAQAPGGAAVTVNRDKRGGSSRCQPPQGAAIAVPSLSRWSESCDHVRCVAGWAKLAVLEGPDVEHEGYATAKIPKGACYEWVAELLDDVKDEMLFSADG